MKDKHIDISISQPLLTILKKGKSAAYVHLGHNL